MKTQLKVSRIDLVKSSNVSKIAFHDNTTFVEFKNGGLYKYKGTTEKDYKEFLNAKSLGKHLNSNIKDNFDFEKLEAELIVTKPSLLEGLNKEIIKSIKDKEKNRVKVLKLIKAELLNNQKSKKPTGEQNVVESYYKKLFKTLSLFSGKSKEDLKIEIKIIGEFLPKQMSETELVDFIKTCFKVHVSYETLSIGEIIKKIKFATKSNNGMVIAREVKKLKVHNCNGRRKKKN